MQEGLDEVPVNFPIEIEDECKCPVCLSHEETILLKLGCEHTICESCLRQLRPQTCPKCRGKITMNLVRKKKI